MMNRLTKHWGNNYVATELNYNFMFYMSPSEVKKFEDIIKKLSYYEDLEEEGRLITLNIKDTYPCNKCDVG